MESIKKKLTNPVNDSSNQIMVIQSAKKQLEEDGLINTVKTKTYINKNKKI
jgi:hypothetical protein